MDLLPPYPISMNKFTHMVEHSGLFKLDEDGVLMYKLPYTSNFVYYPVSIAQYSLGCYEYYYKNEDRRNRECFLKNANWLMENLIIRDDIAVWEHRFPLPYGYNFKIPWVHGMAQSLGVSVMIRAHILSGERKYVEIIPKILKSFDRDIAHGGVRFVDKDGNVWFEEYGVLPPTHILNGFIFILLGFWEAKEYAYVEVAERFLVEGVETLTKNLKRYDTGYWSLYDLIHKYPATEDYHKLHIDQLRVLGKLTGKNIFLEFAERWEGYLNSGLSKIRAKYKRGLIHIKKLGIVGAARRSIEMHRYYQ